MQKKIIGQYIVLSALFSAIGLSLQSAIYVTFLMKNGLSLFEVNMVNTCFFLTLFACEIPTGAFADIFGRKTAFVFSCALMSLSMFVYGSSDSLSGFILAEVICAIGVTFRSGAFQAWFVDSLKHTNYTGDLTKIFARENLFCQIGGGLGAIAGSYLYTFNATWPWYCGGTGLLVVTIAAQITMKENYFKRQKLSWKKGMVSMRDTVKTSIHYGMNDKAVRFILLITFMQIFAVQALNMYWQPFFKSYGVNESSFGFIYAGIMAFVAIGSFLVLRMKSTGREKSLILRIQIITGIFVILTVMFSSLPIILTLFLLHEMTRGMCPPLKDSFLQKRIPSAERATITSFCAIAPHIGGVFGLLVSGAIAQYCGISFAWIVSGIVLIVGALLVKRNGSQAPDTVSEKNCPMLVVKPIVG